MLIICIKVCSAGLWYCDGVEQTIEAINAIWYQLLEYEYDDFKVLLSHENQLKSAVQIKIKGLVVDSQRAYTGEQMEDLGLIFLDG